MPIVQLLNPAVSSAGWVGTEVPTIHVLNAAVSPKELVSTKVRTDQILKAADPPTGLMKRLGDHILVMSPSRFSSTDMATMVASILSFAVSRGKSFTTTSDLVEGGGPVARPPRCSPEGPQRL